MNSPAAKIDDDAAMGQGVGPERPIMEHPMAMRSASEPAAASGRGGNPNAQHGFVKPRQIQCESRRVP